MLTPPDLAHEHITACLFRNYGLTITHIVFLPLGADLQTAVYRVSTADDTPYFLKLRGGNFNEVAVSVPVYLRDVQGISTVMAPLPTVGGELWIEANGFFWMLYPFVEGVNAYDQPLSDDQWRTFGATLNALHHATLPQDLLERVPRERFDAHWRDIVRALDAEVSQRHFDDPIANEMATLWKSKQGTIEVLIERAETLGATLQNRAMPFVLCHADIHSWNILLGAQGEFYIVDWDTLLLAPKERDLMFIGSGLGAIWNTSREEHLFYQGYGTTEIDWVALSYYRYERIVEDLAVTGEQVLRVHGSDEDRAQGVRQIASQFGSTSEIACAHRTYEKMLDD